MIADDYDEKYMKINFNPGDDFPLKETLEVCNMTIIDF